MCIEGTEDQRTHVTHAHAQVVENIIKPLTRRTGGGATGVGERYVSLTQEAIDKRLAYLPTACREAPPAVEEGKVRMEGFTEIHEDSPRFTEIHPCCRAFAVLPVTSWRGREAVGKGLGTERHVKRRLESDPAPMRTLLQVGKPTFFVSHR